MTPLEIEAEEKAYKDQLKKREADEEFFARLIDEHFAILSALIHNANFKRRVSPKDYSMIQEKKYAQKLSPEAQALDAKLRAQAQARLKAKGVRL